MLRSIGTPNFSDCVRNPFPRMWNDQTHWAHGDIIVNDKRYGFEVVRINNAARPNYDPEDGPRIDYWCELQTVDLPAPIYSRRVPEKQMNDVRSVVIKAFVACVREMAEAL